MNPVEEVKSRIDIVDVISKHVELKRAGRNYKALCPFHTEKTPSFVVFPETQTWRCFGACAEGGDVYSFLMKKNGWDFGETLRTLAEQTGVELRPHTPEQEQRREAHARLYELLDAATFYYMNLLRNAPAAETARDYVVERGLLPHIVEQFQLGYALDQWDGARNYLCNKGYDDDELLAAGLLVEKEDTGRRYDRFRGRLLIPIRDLRGRVVGFGARALQPDAVPKYLNSPQTDLFDKSRLLYGLDMAKKGIREAGQAIIVEGYMDVMQGRQAGYSNIIAQMGTALTEAQLRQLKRYTGRLILALDADAAGQKATLRGLDVARQTLDREVEVVFDPRGLVRHESRLQADIRIVTLPAGFDPDKLIKSDPAAWGELIASARPVVEYIIDSIVAEVDPDDAKDKSAAVARAMPIIRDVANAIERDHYTQHLARRLGIDERTLVSMAARPGARRLRTRGRSAPPPPPPPEWETGEPGAPSPPTPAQQPPPSSQELYCLNQLLTTPAAWRQADHALQSLDLPPISTQDFADPQNRAIFAALHSLSASTLHSLSASTLHSLSASTAQQLDIPDNLQEKLDESLLPRLRAIQSQQSPDPSLPLDKIASHLVYTVLLMRKKATRRAKRELNSAWAEALAQGEQSTVGAYHQQVLELEALRLKIDRALEFIINPLASNHERERKS